MVASEAERTELGTKAEVPRGQGPHPPESADTSLYRRFQQVGPTQLKMFPQPATYADRARLQFMESGIFPALPQRKRWSGRPPWPEERWKGPSLSSSCTTVLWGPSLDYAWSENRGARHHLGTLANAALAHPQ